MIDWNDDDDDDESAAIPKMRPRSVSASWCNNSAVTSDEMESMSILPGTVSDFSGTFNYQVAIDK